MVYDESQTIDLDNVPLDGGILVKVLVLSIDPFLRRRMREPNLPGDPFLVSEFAVRRTHLESESRLICVCSQLIYNLSNRDRDCMLATCESPALESEQSIFTLDIYLLRR